MVHIESLSFPTSYLQIVKEICQARGVDADQYLTTSMGVTSAQLDDPQSEISGRQFYQLLSVMEEFIFEDPSHQHLLIDFFPATVHGYVALAAITSETVGSAIDVALKYAHQIMPAFEITSEVNGQQCHMCFKRVAEIEPYNELMTEIVFCAIHSFLQIFGQKDVDVELSLQHGTLLLTELPQIFSTLSVTTSCDENHLSFDAKYLDDKLATRNETVRQSIEQALEENETRLAQQNSLQYQVAEIILSKLQQQLPVEADEIAKQLLFSSRTFSRRLSEEGTNFRQLHNECRCNIAKDLLSTSSLTVSEISEQLGFSDEGNFSRFFKQQTGSSPLQFRKISRGA